jgi:transcriptional regulator with XRE-family HTH domain
MKAKPSEQPRTLAEKLQHLFVSVKPAGRGEYSNHEVATAIEAAGGPTISATYVWQLRKGLRTNPTLNHLEALAAFFGVPTSYFLDEAKADEINSQLELLTALRHAEVQAIAMRASGVSPEGLKAIVTMLDHVRRAEGLPPASTTNGSLTG